MEDKVRAYYFASKDKKLRYGDGRDIVVGDTHSVCLKKRSLRLCSWGLHASERAIDALSYAPGSILYIVELSGKIDTGKDKLCAEHRTYIQEIDADKLLREFARKQALLNIEKIYPYVTTKEKESILTYLEGKDLSESAARSARSAARSAAWSARSAARSAAWSAESAARSAANEMLEETINQKILKSNLKG